MLASSSMGLRKLWIYVLAGAYFWSGCAHARRSSSSVVSIPEYSPYLVTHDSTGASVSGMVGTVQDSASGRPLEAAQIVLTSQPTRQHYFSYTNQEGGFILPAVPPGSYDLIVRKVNYRPYTTSYTLRTGSVDTLRVRILAFPFRPANTTAESSWVYLGTSRCFDGPTQT
jgi:hypothetical protein